MVKFRLFLISLFFSLTIINAQSITVSATTDSTKYKVGDYIKYQLELRYDKSIKVELPPVKDSVKVLTYIKALPVDSSQADNKIVEKYTYIFSKYDSSQATIPSLKVAYTVGSDTVKKFLATNPITINVTTLKVNTQEDIKDVKEPMSIPWNWLLIIAIVLVIAGLIVGTYFLYRRYKKKHGKKENIQPEIIIPSYEVALTKLHELEEKKLWQNGHVKEYHSEVTEIARQYFEDRFDFRALEMTSAEILGVLSYIEDGKKIINIADSFFSNADLVKFAKFEPMPKVNEEMMQQACEIVNQTIPEPPQPETSEDQNVQ
jgi:hypothetical protein